MKKSISVTKSLAAVATVLLLLVAAQVIDAASIPQEVEELHEI